MTAAYSSRGGKPSLAISHVGGTLVVGPVIELVSHAGAVLLTSASGPPLVFSTLAAVGDHLRATGVFDPTII